MSRAVIAGLSVVILSYGREPVHHPLVHALVDEHDIRPEQIIVLHNPSGEHDLSVPASVRGEHVERATANRGYAGGMNAGARLALVHEPSWLLLITPSLELHPGAVAALVSAGEAAPDVGVLGPVIYRPDTSIFSSGVARIYRRMVHVQDRPVPGSVVSVDAIDGAMMLVRSAAFAQVGGLDDRFFMYWEETDFCSRAVQAGWRIVVVADAGVTSEPGGSSRPAAYCYLMARNGLEYARRTGSSVAVLAYALALVEMLTRVTVRQIRPRYWTWRSWRDVWLRWVGTSYGTVDFVQGRWGKPPEPIRRRSDIA